jgi:NADP-reducing hydrogenase subunit HndA
MSCTSIGTPEQDQRLKGVLATLKGKEGATMVALQKAQDIYGYVPIKVQQAIADELDVSLEKVYGVSTFYSQFCLEPKGKHKIGVCLGTACYVKGSGDVMAKVEKTLGIRAGQTTKDGKFTIDATRCIGCCGLAPVFTVNDDVYGKSTPDQVEEILKKYN